MLAQGCVALSMNVPHVLQVPLFVGLALVVMLHIVRILGTLMRRF